MSEDVKLNLTPASKLGIRSVKWLWSEYGDRIPVGELVLLAGREGSGKSTLDAWLTANVTRGTLPGAYFGTPKSVLVVATEDDWETTLVPRLTVAGADLTRVFRVDVTVDGREGALSLPDDIDMLEKAITETDAGLVVLSPLMSRLSRRLDTYKDAEVRQSLEPLVAIAKRARCTFLGLIHLRKQGGDPLHAIMGSTAFPAVARAVMYVQRDEADPSVRVLGQPKNNLGLIDPDLGGMPQFTIEEKYAGKDDDGDIVTATRVKWLTETRDGTIAAVIQPQDATEKSQVELATEWLRAFIEGKGGEAAYKDIEAAAHAERFTTKTLQRACTAARVKVSNTKTYPRRTVWALPKGFSVTKKRGTVRT